MLKVHTYLTELPTSNMTDSQDVSEQELEVLSGDVIVNDLCSSKQIVNTPMSLCKIATNVMMRGIEDQLCTLRDLTTEGEVVSLLMLHDFPNIAKLALMISNEPRSTEIILGIIGNLCSSDEAIDTIGRDQELVTQILSRLESNDTLILIQLMRILKLVAMHIIIINHQSVWIAHLTECKFFGDSIIFILKNSTNGDLLTGAVDMLKSIFCVLFEDEECEELWLKLFKVDDLIPAMFKSFMQIISTETRKTRHFEWEFSHCWVECLYFTILYLEYELEWEIDETEERFLELTEIIYRILEPFKKPCNLYPIRERGVLMIYDVIGILCILSRFAYRFHVNEPRIHSILATITFSVKTVSVSDSRKELDPDERTVELLNYMNGYWLHTIEYWTGEQIGEILRLCERDVREYLINALQSHSEVTPEALDKIKIAAIAVENF